MAERKESSLQGRELSGILLFTLSAFPVVLVGLALVKGEEPVGRGTARFAQTLIEAAGYLPVLLCAGGFAAIGATLLLSNRELDLGRHLSGFLFAAVGLAVILGAFHDQPVGVFHGGGLGAATGGLLRSGIGAWSGALIGGAVLFVSAWLAWLGGHVTLPARKRPASATLSHALTENDMDGVSVAEATALVPDASTLAYMEQLWRRTSSSSSQAAPLPPSPYPEDVRRLGQVPEGARPLPRTHEPPRTHRQDLAAAVSGKGSAADDRADLGLGSHLAGEPALAPAEPRSFRRGTADVDPFGRDSEALTLTAEEARVVAGAPRVPEPPAAPHIPEGARPLAARAASGPGGGPPVPTWEAATAEEEPAISSTFLRRERASEDDPTVDRPGLEAELPFDALERDGALAEYGDSEDDYDDEDDDEDEDDEEDEDEDFDDDEEEEEEEEDDDFDEEDAAGAPPVHAGVAEASSSSEVEPQVVLRPQAARGQPSAPRDTAEPADGRGQLLQDAGTLFLEQGRVAVSLLQRRFGLEFDEACEVLDELQDLGLIGPYKGGQQRDILLSLEEWQSRVAAT